jgi:hypothetical protein
MSTRPPFIMLELFGIAHKINLLEQVEAQRRMWKKNEPSQFSHIRKESSSRLNQSPPVIDQGFAIRSWKKSFGNSFIAGKLCGKIARVRRTRRRGLCLRLELLRFESTKNILFKTSCESRDQKNQLVKGTAFVVRIGVSTSHRNITNLHLRVEFDWLRLGGWRRMWRDKIWEP